MKYQYILTAVCCIVAVQNLSIAQTLTGKVLDENGKRVAGATLSLSSSGATFMSDSTGNFRVDPRWLPDSVAISYLGYRTVKVYIRSANDFPLSVTLTKTLDELPEVLVSTGYYEVPLERSTGSFAQVDNKLFNRSASRDIVSRLEGVVPGLQFDRRDLDERGEGSPQLRVRGVATIESEAAPLIVLDDFPYEGDINSINPNDVESITVLKDAAAASIWGARAGNGVIVIKTKRGGYGQKMRISLNNNVTIGDKPDLYYGKDRLPAEIVMAIEKELFGRGNYDEDPRTVLPEYVELLIRQRDGQIDDVEFAEWETRLRNTDVRKEALTHLYQSPITRQSALNISGGSAVNKFYLSVAQDSYQQNVKQDGGNRLNLNLQNTFRPIENLELTGGIWYSKQKSYRNGISFSDLGPIGSEPPSPYLGLLNADGSAAAIPHGLRYPYQLEAENDGLVDWMYRPLDEPALTDNVSFSREMRVNGKASYRFLDLFNINLAYQYRQSVGGGETRYDPESYFVRDMVNRFTQMDGERVIPYGGILSISPARTNTSQLGRAQLNYAQTFGKEHQVFALIGGEVREQVQTAQPSIRIYNFDSSNLTGTNMYDYKTTFPTRPAGSARIPSPSASLSSYTDRFLSYYGNAAYTYRNRYTFTGSLRWDASNLFGVKANQKGVPLWSAGLSWNMAQEPFFKTDAISYLKLRLTYGSAGNVNNQVSSMPVVSYTVESRTQLPRGYVVSAGNPSLQWEQVNTFNIGVDFADRSQRFRGTVEYYDKQARDLIGEDYMAPSTGIIPRLTQRIRNRINYASVYSKGADAQFSIGVLTKGVRWNIDLIGGWTKNAVTDFNTQETASITAYLLSPPPVLGHSRDAIYAYPWIGLDHSTGMPLVETGGQIGMDYDTFVKEFRAEDLLVAGVTMPRFHGAFRNTFSWRDIEVSANVQWKAGYVFRRGSISPGQEYLGPQNYHMDYFRRWEKPGDEAHTDIPAYASEPNSNQSTVYKWSTALVEKGDHIRLQDVSIGYSLRRGVFPKLPVEQVRLYAYCNNLGILWRSNKEGIDPDYVNVTSPPARSYAFGLQINF